MYIHKSQGFFPVLFTLALASYDLHAHGIVGVTRLNDVKGDVSFLPGGESTWVNAERNRPLIPGDKVWNDAGSYSSLQVANATACAGPSSLVTVLNVNDVILQLQLASGSIDFYVGNHIKLQAYEINTPNVVLSVTEPGHYRITVDEVKGTTVVNVNEGEADIYGLKSSAIMGAGQSIEFYDNNLKKYQAANTFGNDELQKWCANQLPKNAKATSIIGYDDLEYHGAWQEIPEYGMVWSPNGVSSDWTPYRDGHWVWAECWGWTWVADEPWGFAPYHYGRWTYKEGTWYWVPGTQIDNVEFMPAVVSFIMLDNNGVIGWFPWAPGDTDVLKYKYQKAEFAITAISKAAFVDSLSASKAKMSVSKERLNAAAISAVPAVVPTMASILGARKDTNKIPPAHLQNVPIMYMSLIPPSSMSLKEKAPLLEKTPGVALDLEKLNVGRADLDHSPHTQVRAVKPAAKIDMNSKQKPNFQNMEESEDEGGLEVLPPSEVRKRAQDQVKRNEELRKREAEKLRREKAERDQKRRRDERRQDERRQEEHRQGEIQFDDHHRRDLRDERNRDDSHRRPRQDDNRRYDDRSERRDFQRQRQEELQEQAREQARALENQRRRDEGAAQRDAIEKLKREVENQNKALREQAEQSRRDAEQSKALQEQRRAAQEQRRIEKEQRRQHEEQMRAEDRRQQEHEQQKAQRQFEHEQARAEAERQQAEQQNNQAQQIEREKRRAEKELHRLQRQQPAETQPAPQDPTAPPAPPTNLQIQP